MNEPLKYDQGKPRWDLLPLHLIERVVEVYTFGAQKYAPDSWQNLPDGYNRYKATLLRHLTAHDKGVFVMCGCFRGTLDEFAKKVEQTHGDNKHARDYQLLIEFAKKKYKSQ